MKNRTLVVLCSVSILTSCAIVDREQMGGMESLVTWKQTAAREAQIAAAGCEEEYKQASDRVAGLVNRIHAQIDVVKHEYFSQVDMSDGVVSRRAEDAVAGFFSCAMGDDFERGDMYGSGRKKKALSGTAFGAAAIEAGKVVAEMVKEAKSKARKAGAEVLHERISVALWTKWDDLLRNSDS